MTWNLERLEKILISAIVSIVVFLAFSLLFQYQTTNIQPSVDSNISLSIDEVIQKLEENAITNDIPPREEMFRIAVDAIIKEVGDEHGGFLTFDDYQNFQKFMTPTHYGGLNIEVTRELGVGEHAQILILQIFDNSPLHTFGILPGDTITHVNGVQVTKSNWSDMVQNLRGAIGSDVTVTMKREGNRPLGDITFSRVNAKSQAIFAKHEDCYLNLRISKFVNFSLQEVTDTIKSTLRDCSGGLRGMVLDLRNNSGGSLTGALTIAELFLDPDEMILRSVTRNNLQDRTFPAITDAVIPKDAPMVVLVNGNTASASEIVTGAIMKYRPNAVVVGTNTYGKGSIQTIFPMSDGTTAVKITTAKYLAGGTITIDKVGIRPKFTLEQPLAPGNRPLHQRVNSVLIINSMNPAVDHQLRLAYNLVVYIANNDNDITQPMGMIVLQGIEHVKKIKPIPITSSVCRSVGLRGCPKPGSVYDGASEGVPQDRS